MEKDVKLNIPHMKDDEYQSTAIHNSLPVIVCESSYKIVMPSISLKIRCVCVLVIYTVIDKLKKKIVALVKLYTHKPWSTSCTGAIIHEKWDN